MDINANKYFTRGIQDAAEEYIKYWRREKGGEGERLR